MNLRISAVSYLNTKPFLYGLYHHELDQQIDFQLDIPSVCAQKLRDGQVDIGLIPAAMLLDLPEVEVISEYCIGAEGAVRTVCIYADQPLEKIRTLHLDYQSRTSATLTRYLLQEYWKMDIEIKQGGAGFEQKIGGDVAALVIGDRCIEQEIKHPYRYDLAEAWQKHTGRPFVFAVWVTRKPLPEAFVQQFNAALATGLQRRPQLLHLLQDPAPHFSLHDYYYQYIQYVFDAPKRAALQHFLEEIQTHNLFKYYKTN